LVLFPAALTPIRPAAAGPFDQCDLWKRNFGRAQSKPTQTMGIRSRLDTGQRPRSKVFLFPVKRVLLSVPLELVLNC
jgi:hypothetical protein